MRPLRPMQSRTVPGAIVRPVGGGALVQNAAAEPPRTLNPMLPTLPPGLRPYDPPVEPVAPPVPAPLDGVPVIDDASGFEARSVQYSWPWSANLLGGLGPVVYTTRRRWNACDVYVSSQVKTSGAAFEKGVLSILIYAVSQSGRRTLVGSGRVADALGDFAVAEPLWIAAARSAAQRFEVVLAMYQSPGSAAADVDLTVTVVASDLAVDPPPLLGAIPVGHGAPSSGGQTISLSGGVDLGNGLPANIIQIPDPELVGLQWVNGAGAARYLQYFEGGPAPVSGATVPTMIWPLGSQNGDGIFDWEVRRRTRALIGGLRGNPPGFCALRVSTTPNVYTAPAGADCFGQTFFR